MSLITKTIKQVMPAVVSIVITKSLEEIEKEMPADMMPIMPFGGTQELNIPPDKIDAHGMVQIGGGSGFIVDPTGVIVTNKHVVADPKATYTVITSDGKKHEAEILARDPMEDVAVLKIEGKNLPIIGLADSSRLELGETVLAIGNTLGLFSNTVSSGIISGLSRSISARTDQNSQVQELRGLIQTDAAINPGNSGGPLINIDGKAIGINAAIVFGAQNVGFAIPINAVKRDIVDVKQYGRVRRPLLGLRYVTIDEDLKEKMKLPVDYGALVAGREGTHHQAIVPNTPAAVAGIKEKDIILECNGVKVTTEKTIQDFLEDMKVGDVLAMKVLRGNEHIELRALLSERK
ncbi:MAG: trypsin-like peptidase domain-containing protein [bacterium]|nr:trypsin-like peptidase domain-containing protein [bacterium]